MLLTACVNVATWLLARSVARRREFAIRAILGASPGRHVRQRLADSLVLAILGCGLGVLLAEWLSPITAQLIPSNISDQLGLATLHTDWRVATFAVAVSLASAIVAGLIPAFGSWKTDPQAALSDGGRTMSSSRRGRRLLGTLIVAETAVTLVPATRTPCSTSTIGSSRPACSTRWASACFAAGRSHPTIARGACRS